MKSPLHALPWVLVALAAVAALALPAMRRAIAGVALVSNSVTNAQALFAVIQQEETDRREGGSGPGLPRESGVRTTREYLALLVKEGYLRESDLKLFDGLVLTNASVVDPPNTVLIVSRSVYEAVRKHSPLPSNWIVLDKQGHGIPCATLFLPPRDPPFLAP